MSQTNTVEATTEATAVATEAKVKSPAEIALGTLKTAITKLSKVEEKAGEYDAKVAAINTEIIGFASGTVKQTGERNMLSVSKEQAAAENKAAKIRKSGATLAGQVNDALEALREIAASLTAPYSDVVSDGTVDPELDSEDGMQVEE